MNTFKPLTVRKTALHPRLLSKSSTRTCAPRRSFRHIPRAENLIVEEESSSPDNTSPDTSLSPENTIHDVDHQNSLNEELTYVERSSLQKAATSFRLAFALPWRRFKSGSALTMKLSGSIAEQPQSRFSSTTSLPDICSSLIKAAYDPRIVGLVVKIDPLQTGWAKLTEIRRHIEIFKKSGKFTVAYLERAGEKEYYLATAFDEIYAPPSASLSLRGLAVTGTFLRGVFDKIGVEPEVRRIGKFKSAGDQLLRKDMSDAQREQLTALLDDIYNDFTNAIALSRKKTQQEVIDLLNSGTYQMETFKQDGWITDLKYEDEINDLIKERTGGKEDELRAVGLKKYARVGRSAFHLDGGKKTIAIIRTSGAILGGGGSGNTITSTAVIAQLRRLKKNKNIAAVVLRVDSPGGDALASDLMWREIRKLSEDTPVIASMADVAASGGYYMSMACRKIVAEALTLTGSIGVVTAKFSLGELYKRAGYNKEVISRGKYAELLVDNRGFNEEESKLFDEAVEYAYAQFRDKAAESRGLSIEQMQDVAQGRVWSGKRAVEIGLVDAIGGVEKAIALAKDAAGIGKDEKVRVVEMSRASVSPLALLSGAGGANALMQSMRALIALSMFLQNSNGSAAARINLPDAMATGIGGAGLMSMLTSMAFVRNPMGTGESGATSGIGNGLTEADSMLMQGLSHGVMMAQLPDVCVEGVVSQSLKMGGGVGYVEVESELFADC